MSKFNEYLEAIKKKNNPINNHQLKIAIDTIKNPMKGKFLGGPSEEEAIDILKNEFNYTDQDIEKLRIGK